MFTRYAYRKESHRCRSIVCRIYFHSIRNYRKLIYKEKKMDSSRCCARPFNYFRSICREDILNSKLLHKIGVASSSADCTAVVNAPEPNAISRSRTRCGRAQCATSETFKTFPKYHRTPKKKSQTLRNWIFFFNLTLETQHTRGVLSSSSSTTAAAFKD